MPAARLIELHEASAKPPPVEVVAVGLLLPDEDVGVGFEPEGEVAVGSSPPPHAARAMSARVVRAMKSDRARFEPKLNTE
jgi:hypothetical protein